MSFKGGISVTDIIVALIAAGGGALGAVIGILTNTRLVAYRLEQLEHRVNEHNQVVTRMYNIEARMDVQEEKMDVANHRIGDLEKGV